MIQKIIPIFIVALLYSSCQNKSYYQKTETIPTSGWALEKALSF